MKDIVVFSLSANPDLAQEVVNHLGVDLGKISVRHFKDGEILVEPEQSVRGRNVFIIQSTCGPVNEHLMELLICIDACKRASANSITAVIPYYGYARQDRKARARQPITSKLVANLLETSGVNRVITIDLHARQIQGFFDIPTDDLSAVSMIGQYFRNKGFMGDGVVCVSPDHGGATRARKLADCLHTNVAIIDKRRPKENQCEALNVIGDVDGKVAIIIDDICDTGGSLLAGVNMLLENGATAVYAAVTHGVLSSPAAQNIENSNLTQMIVTNTIPLSEETKKVSKLKQVSVGYMLAKTIEAVNDYKPVSDVYNLFNEE
ncbi:MAG: ribose-phosphate pyrophosphokinase [Erysipelotrichaceae bacterium]